MYLTRNTGKLPLARVLALVALLCAGAMQVQEAGHSHWHELDDSYSQCLVCKSSGGIPLPLEAPAVLLPTAVQAALVLCPGDTLPSEALSFHPRGPPQYS